MEKKRVLGCLCAVFAGVAYGICPILMRCAQNLNMNSQSISAWRFSTCIMFLACFAAIKHINIKLDKNALKLFVLGMLVYSTMTGFNLAGIARIPVGVATLLLCVFPLYVTLFCAILRHEKLTYQKIGALGSFIVGIILLLGVTFEPVNPFGLLMSTCAGLSYSAYAILGSKISGKIDPIASAFFLMSGAASAYIIIGAVSGKLAVVLEPKAYVLLLLMGLIGTAAPVALYWKSVELIGVTKASILGTAEPIVTAVLGVIIFDEAMTFAQAIGAAIIVLGIIVIQLPERQTINKNGN